MDRELPVILLATPAQTTNTRTNLTLRATRPSPWQWPVVPAPDTATRTPRRPTPPGWSRTRPGRPVRAVEKLSSLPQVDLRSPALTKRYSANLLRQTKHEFKQEICWSTRVEQNLTSFGKFSKTCSVENSFVQSQVSQNKKKHKNNHLICYLLSQFFISL